MSSAARCGFVGLIPILLLGFGSGCVEPAGATRIVGPDGTRMLHVHCGDEQVACFQLAGELCPQGYFLSPIFDPRDGNFLVRCRDALSAHAIARVAPAPTRPSQGTVARARPAEDGWPPVEVARPAEPWPTPSASSESAPKPTSAAAVDLGY